MKKLLLSAFMLSALNSFSQEDSYGALLKYNHAIGDTYRVESRSILAKDNESSVLRVGRNILSESSDLTLHVGPTAKYFNGEFSAGVYFGLKFSTGSLRHLARVSTLSDDLLSPSLRYKMCKDFSWGDVGVGFSNDLRRMNFNRVDADVDFNITKHIQLGVRYQLLNKSLGSYSRTLLSLSLDTDELFSKKK